MSSVEEQTRAAESEFIELWARGPTNRRWSELPPQVGDAAPDLQLEDSSGNQVSLSDFWAERPALLLFWRHFGCGCGADRATRLGQEYRDYVEAGANVVLIGQGEPERSAVYAQAHGIECPVLCDPAYRAYESYGLREGQVEQLLFDAPQEFWSHSREVGQQFQQARRESGRSLVDNPWLLPGEFVIERSGMIRLAYRYQYCEDFPNPLVLAGAIREAS
jgi:peroxiredoxin